MKRYWTQDRCKKVLGVGIRHPDAACLRKLDYITAKLHRLDFDAEFDRWARTAASYERLASVTRRIHFDGRGVEFRRNGGIEVRTEA